MIWMPAIALNALCAFCALLVSFGGYAKWPRLTAMFGGIFIGNSMMMLILAMIN